MKRQNLIKTLFQATLFTILLIIFYFMYMKTAIEQFTKASTTVSQTTKELKKLEPPIFLFCVDPPFKPSFFKNHSVTNLGVEKYFWLFPHTQKLFKNNFAPDLYTSMSHHLGSDWKIMMVEIDYQKWVLHEFLN